MTSEEDSFRKNSRRVAGIGFMLFGFGILIITIGVMIAIASILGIPSFRIPGLGMGALTAEATRAMVGIVLAGIGIVFYIIFAIYAGFKGRSVVSKVDLAGWERYVRSLGIMYFIATLLVTIGIFIIPGTSMIYKDIILMLISSVLLMVSALLVPFHKQSIATGIILIIAAIFILLPFQFSQLSPFLSLVPSLSQVLTTISIVKILPAVSLIIVGVALVLRGIVPRPLIYHIIAAVGGLIYVISVMYVSFSTLSSVSETSSYIEMLSMYQSYMPGAGTVISALWILYYTSIVGSSLAGIAGILGMVALLLALIYMIKKGLAGAGVTVVREARYCPSCGASVELGDAYCRKCGRKLIGEETLPPPP